MHKRIKIGFSSILESEDRKKGERNHMTVYGWCDGFFCFVEFSLNIGVGKQTSRTKAYTVKRNYACRYTFIWNVYINSSEKKMYRCKFGIPQRKKED